MIPYLFIAATLFFILVVLMSAAGEYEGFGYAFFCALIWPLSLFFIIALGLGALIRKVFNL